VFIGAWYIILFPHVDGTVVDFFIVWPIHPNSPNNQLICKVHLEFVASQVLAEVLVPRVGLVGSNHFDDGAPHCMQDTIKNPVEDSQVELVQLEQQCPICGISVLVVCPIHMVRVIGSHLVTWNLFPFFSVATIALPCGPLCPLQDGCDETQQSFCPSTLRLGQCIEGLFDSGWQFFGGQFASIRAWPSSRPHCSAWQMESRPPLSVGSH
jgi:hypothetical protein